MPTRYQAFVIVQVLRWSLNILSFLYHLHDSDPVIFHDALLPQSHHGLAKCSERVTVACQVRDWSHHLTACTTSLAARAVKSVAGLARLRLQRRGHGKRGNLQHCTACWMI